MAKSETFKVSKKGHDEVELNDSRVPETLEEFESLNLVSKFPDDVIDLARQSIVIKMQSGARSRIDQGQEAMQDYVDNYTFGARTGGGGARKPTLTKDKAKDLKFSKAQLEALRAAGVQIEDESEE